MCGRFTIVMTMEELMIRYAIDEIISPFNRPNYNVAPTQMIPAIMNDGEKTLLDQRSAQMGPYSSMGEEP